MVSQAFVNSFSRVWFQDGGPGPARNRTYQGNWKAGAVSWDKGDLTVIREPDPNSYGAFSRVGRFRGEPGDPELPIMARYSFQRSKLLKAARFDCEHAIQLHIGKCKNPQIFDRGWDKVLILEGAAITNYSTDDLGAMDPSETSAVNEDVPFKGVDLYEVFQLNFSAQAGAAVTREITSIYVCDAQQCGACGASSDGCQVVVALEGGVSASPGLPPRVHYTTDGGATWATRTVTTLAANQAGTVIFCAGLNTVVLSADDNALHYIPISNLVAGTGSWTEVTTGFGTAAQAPLAAWSLGASETWIVGEGGYIFFTDDPINGVVQKDAGVTTTQNLNDVHFYDSLNGVAVGASNTVVFTANQGVSWTSVTGPAVGVVLNAVWMQTPTTWFVGTAGGALWYTQDSGMTWVQKRFSGDNVGQVRDIVFVTPSVGYMAHSTATAGRILRTIDGGYSWYVLPEGAGSIPTNDYISRLAVCVDPNIVYAGGLGATPDGIILKAA